MSETAQESEAQALIEEIEATCVGAANYYAMNADETAYSMVFDWRPDGERWLRENPIQAEGRHLVRQFAFGQAERLALRAAKLLRATLAAQPKDETPC